MVVPLPNKRGSQYIWGKSSTKYNAAAHKTTNVSNYLLFLTKFFSTIFNWISGERSFWLTYITWHLLQLKIRPRELPIYRTRPVPCTFLLQPIFALWTSALGWPAPADPHQDRKWKLCRCNDCQQSRRGHFKRFIYKNMSTSINFNNMRIICHKVFFSLTNFVDLKS